ncbi:MAG: D-aminoacyl-tRNA deacylase [Rikenellaceae bacterium]|nr:D-aminoacyl-tRNA deacylase [Rikenellaceae bacterium]MCL2692304.1 D-aminoacyl-tRNA deacylase [Rikenellaceae bacterium]
MRALIQRVERAAVVIGGQVHAAIGYGILVFVGIETGDTREDSEWLARKIAALRIFDDEAGVMNLSLVQAGGNTLAVSQFTLCASTQKGNRPSYVRASRGEQAIALYDDFVRALSAAIGKPVANGVFGADMQVELVNDGPVTIWIDSRRRE